MRPLKLKTNLRMFVASKTQMGKTTWIKRVVLPRLPAYLVWDLKKQYGGHGVVVHDLKGLEDALSANCCKIIFQPLLITDTAFEELCEFIFFHLRGFTFIIEEVHQVVSKHKIGFYFKQLLTVCMGEPYFIGIIAISQRCANVHNDIIGSSGIVVCFKMFLPCDAEAIGVIPANDILALEPYACLIYNEDERDNPIDCWPPLPKIT